MYSELRNQWNKALADSGVSDSCERCGGAGRPLDIPLDAEELDSPEMAEALAEEHCYRCGRKLVHELDFAEAIDEDGNEVVYVMYAIQVPLWRAPLVT